MARIDKKQLVREASRARERAVAPYSKFKVGAALLTKDGEIISGANVESARLPTMVAVNNGSL